MYPSVARFVTTHGQLKQLFKKCLLTRIIIIAVFQDIQSCLTVSWAGKLLFWFQKLIWFQVDGKYTINQSNPSF